MEIKEMKNYGLLQLRKVKVGMIKLVTSSERCQIRLQRLDLSVKLVKMLQKLSKMMSLLSRNLKRILIPNLEREVKKL